MKILLAHTYYRTSAPSGEDAVFENEKKLLEDAGHEVFAFEKYNDDIDDSSVAKKLKIALNTSWSNSSMHDMEAALLKFKPDVMHVHNTFPQMSPSIYKACFEKNVPVIQTLHNFRMICPNAFLQRNNKPCELCLSEKIIPLSALKYKCYRNSRLATSALVLMIARNRLNGAYKNYVTKYVSLTQFGANKMIEGGLSPDKVLIKPNFIYEVDLDGGASCNEDYIVYVGRLSEEKGIKTLLNACELNKSTLLKVLGGGPLEDELKKHVKDSSLNVEFLGYQDKETVLNVVKNAKLLVVPSEWYEGFPMTVLEALSVGTPILASRIGSLEEIIEDNVTGLKFEAGNHRDLSDKLNDLLGRPDAIIEMSKKSRKVYEEKYSPETNLKILIEIYEKALRDYA